MARHIFHPVLQKVFALHLMCGAQFHVDHRGRCTQHGEIVRHQCDFAAIDAREAGNLGVSRRLVFHFRPYADRKAAGFEKAVLVDQIVDAFARVEQPLGLAFGEFLRPAHGEGALGPVPLFVEGISREARARHDHLQRAPRRLCRSEQL